MLLATEGIGCVKVEGWLTIGFGAVMVTVMVMAMAMAMAMTVVMAVGGCGEACSLI